jgi:TonB family protein
MKYFPLLLFLSCLIFTQCSITRVPNKRKHLPKRNYTGTTLEGKRRLHKPVVPRDSVGPRYDSPVADPGDEDYILMDKMPVPLKAPPPIYPPDAESAKLEGSVWVKCLVDTNGIVKEAIVFKSDAEIFNNAAIAAILQWRFQPGSLNGKIVATWTSVPFRFKLNK